MSNGNSIDDDDWIGAFKNDICGFPKVKNGIITLKNKLGIGVNEINI